MKILNYKEYSYIEIYESYLESNYAPLYHYTDNWAIKSIIETDTLNIGWYDAPFFGKLSKFISLTRNSYFDLSHYRRADCRITLDLDLLKNDYKVISYDYFIHSKKTDISKVESEKRKKINVPYEAEEVILENITNIHKYIISIDYFNITDFYFIEKELKLLLQKNNKISILLIKDNKTIKLL